MNVRRTLAATAVPMTVVVLVVLCLGRPLPCRAEIQVSLLADQRFAVAWNGKAAVLPSLPRLRNVGGGKLSAYNPVTRQFEEVVIPASQGGLLRVLNKKRQQVLLGPGTLHVETKAHGIDYRQEFPQARTRWQVAFEAVDENAFDVTLDIETAPNFWLSAFEVELFDLNLENPTGDTGQLRRLNRNPATGELGPVDLRDIRINYPDGPGCYVPAAVLQDQRLAMGVCLQGAHQVWRPNYGELGLKANPEGKSYRVRMMSGWGHVTSLGNFYHQAFHKSYRFRFAEPKPLGPRGYLSLVDAKDLWKDYMRELDEQVPVSATPPYDRSKNNIILMNFMMAEQRYATPDNPQGWLLNSPHWKEDKYEWPRALRPDMSAEQVKAITGFSTENLGRPVQWIKIFAEQNVREMQQANAQAMIVWRTAIHPDPGNDYIPETHLFHPDMEELMPVDGPVCGWDWAVADISVENPRGRVILEKSGVLLHAADTGKLIHVERHLDDRQVLKFRAEDVRAAGKPYLQTAAGLGPRDTLRDKIALLLKVVEPERPLVGRTPGETVEVEALALSNDPVLAAQRLKIKARLTGVRRAAIDVWAKTLSDAGQEFGFLVREDMLVGPPWSQSFQTFDWSAEWQYNMLKQRFQWHRERFGPKCRWFYLDVFADYTPQFLVEMLRADFPDCFFFVEHPNDVVDRTLQGWNWFGALTELEKYVAPNCLVTVLPDRILTGDRQRDRAILGHFWKNPNYFLVAHRTASRLVKLMEEK
jgi:hypothetical protein